MFRRDGFSDENPKSEIRNKFGWGKFAGAIYRDFALFYPASILTGPPDVRGGALPIVRYRVKGKGFKRCWVSGESETGEFVCDLLPTDKAVLGSPALVGELKVAERTVAIALIGPTNGMTTLASVKSPEDRWTLSLSAIRNDPAVREGDVRVLDSEFGEIAKLQRRDFSWFEQMNSRFGFGRSKRGAFHMIAEASLDIPEKQIAVLLLLVCYFQLLELPFNTDTTSS